MTTSHPPEQRDRAELDEAVGLLAEALSTSAERPDAPLRGRVLRRVAASAERHRGLVTTRVHHQARVELAPGVLRSELYRSAAAGETPRRPGEPLSVVLLELAPGAQCRSGLGLAGHASEWLVLSGDLTVDGLALAALDHHGRQPSADEPVLASRTGARVYLRDGGAGATPAATSRAADAQWQDYAPGIRRRVLWEQDHAVAFVARAVDGALVPAHGHRHDEECLMIEGDLFTGDILLRAGDFQLAPAGFDHEVVQAGSDCLLYIRGDAELLVRS